MNCADIISVIKNQLAEGNSRDKVCYFVEYYEFAVRRIERDELAFYPLNFHVVLRLLEDELENYSNNRNLKFFRDAISDVKNKDSVCCETCNYLVTQLLQFMLSDREYSLQICRELLERMEQGKYAIDLCKRLEKILFDEKELSVRKDEIKYIVTSLFVEQGLYGYSKKHIQEFVRNLFKGWQRSGDYIYTYYPFAPEYEEKDASQQLKEYMEKLTIKDRIHDILKLFTKEREKFVFVCGISGMQGQELDFKLGNVTIYNAKLVPKFEFEKKKEEAEKLFDNIKRPIHAAIELYSVDPENFMEEARREIERALDIICCYSAIQVPIYIDMTQYVVLDDKLQVCRSGGGIDDTLHRDFRGINYDRDNMDELRKLYQRYTGVVLETENRLSHVIQNSAGWYRKGEEAKKEEDKLLNYWISLESVFPDGLDMPEEIMKRKGGRESKFDDIYNVIPMMLLRKGLFQYFWDGFYLCSNLYYNNRNKTENNPFPVSKELAVKCGFESDTTVYLLPFLESLHEIIEQIPDGVIKENLSEMQEYIAGGRNIDDLITGIIKGYEHDILIGYRFRNMIVHNARGNVDFLGYYEKKLRMIAGDVVRLVVYLYEEHPEWELSELFIRKNIESREMINELKSMKLVEWMKIRG